MNAQKNREWVTDKNAWQCLTKATWWKNRSNARQSGAGGGIELPSKVYLYICTHCCFVVWLAPNWIHPDSQSPVKKQLMYPMWKQWTSTRGGSATFECQKIWSVHVHACCCFWDLRTQLQVASGYGDCCVMHDEYRVRVFSPFRLLCKVRAVVWLVFFMLSSFYLQIFALCFATANWNILWACNTVLTMYFQDLPDGILKVAKFLEFLLVKK